MSRRPPETANSSRRSLIPGAGGPFAGLALSMLCWSTAWADAVGRQPSAQPAAMEPLAMSSLVQLTLGLLAVLAAIALVAWLMRRVGRFQSGVGGAMRILGGLSMGARERVVLIQVGDTQLLLGVAPGRVQTLHVLPEPIDGASSGSEPGRFAEKLRTVLEKRATS
jgi:flagellar protein FliO/FliZ